MYSVVNAATPKARKMTGSMREVYVRPPWTKRPAAYNCRLLQLRARLDALATRGDDPSCFLVTGGAGFIG